MLQLQRASRQKVMRSVIHKWTIIGYARAVAVWSRKSYKNRSKVHSLQFIKHQLLRSMNRSLAVAVHNWRCAEQSMKASQQSNKVLNYAAESHTKSVKLREETITKKWFMNLMRHILRKYVTVDAMARKEKVLLSWNFHWRRHHDVSDLKRLMAYMDKNKV